MPRQARSPSPLLFFVLVYAFAIPIWIAGSATDIMILPGLPIASLMVICPITAGLLLKYRESGIAGVIALLKRAYDFDRITTKLWYLPVVLIPPGVFALSWAVLRYEGTAVPIPQFSTLSILTLFLMFLVAAFCEELGWSGYVIDPMQQRLGALRASVLLGVIWAVIHFVPLLQAHRPFIWILWWSLGTIAIRVVMVWLFNNTGKSVFAMTLTHALSNLSWQIFPVHGSYFDPRINAAIWITLAAIVTVIWGPRTLAGFRMPQSSPTK